MVLNSGEWTDYSQLSPIIGHLSVKQMCYPMIHNITLDVNWFFGLETNGPYYAFAAPSPSRDEMEAPSHSMAS